MKVINEILIINKKVEPTDTFNNMDELQKTFTSYYMKNGRHKNFFIYMKYNKCDTAAKKIELIQPKSRTVAAKGWGLGEMGRCSSKGANLQL